MNAGPEIKGEMGHNEERNVKPTDLISKEETMFKMGNDGKVIPEKYPVKLYDRALDAELVDESIRLLAALRKHKAIDLSMAEANQKQLKDIDELKSKIEKETDEKKKVNLKIELSQLENTQVIEEFKTSVSSNVVKEGIKESREIIVKLEKMKQDSMEEKFVELQPCNSSEAYLVFDKGKTVDGKETPDFIADVISKKITNPKYTFEDAKFLKPDFKIALKESIMEASGYRMKNYREVMMEEKMKGAKPLTIKKEMPNESKTTPTVSA